jgi:hypothetical protein
MRVTQIFLLFFRNSFSSFDLQLHTQILIYFHIIHSLKSSTCSEHYPAHLQEVYVVTAYMQPLVSSPSAGDCLVHRVRGGKKKKCLFVCLFVCWHSDLEVSCSNVTKTRHGESRCCLRAVAGHKIWHWVGRFETFMERNCWAYEACGGEVWTEGGFTLALFQGWVVESEVLLEQVQLNFSFRNKFTILLLCGRLVDNNTFSKMCIFKSLNGCTVYGGYKKKLGIFLIIIKSNVMKSLCCCMIKMMDGLCLTPI